MAIGTIDYSLRCALCHAALGITSRRNGPSKLIDLREDSIWEFDSSGCSISAALQQLAAALGADETPYQKLPCTAPAKRGVPAQSDALTPRALCAAIVSLQPEDAIVVDESLTSGTSYWELSQVIWQMPLQSYT